VLDTLDMAGRLTTAADLERFALAGNARLTLRSKSTGTRFTYSVKQARFEDGALNTQLYFVKVLTRPDNYDYLGLLRLVQGKWIFTHSPKSRISKEAPSCVAFSYVWRAVQEDHASAFSKIEAWHEGRCGRCNRPLTVPESIERGIGPDCAEMMGM